MDAATDTDRDRTRPWVDEQGVLIVPVSCEPQWRWWTPGGMSLDEILTALEVTRTVWERYSTSVYPEELAKLHYPLVSGVD